MPRRRRYGCAPFFPVRPLRALVCVARAGHGFWPMCARVSHVGCRWRRCRSRRHWSVRLLQIFGCSIEGVLRSSLTVVSVKASGRGERWRNSRALCARQRRWSYAAFAGAAAQWRCFIDRFPRRRRRITRRAVLGRPQAVRFHILFVIRDANRTERAQHAARKRASASCERAAKSSLRRDKKTGAAASAGHGRPCVSTRAGTTGGSASCCAALLARYSPADRSFSQPRSSLPNGIFQ